MPQFNYLKALGPITAYLFTVDFVAAVAGIWFCAAVYAWRKARG